MRIFPLLLFILYTALCLNLSACGQKGPLYLPVDKPTEKPDGQNKKEPQETQKPHINK